MPPSSTLVIVALMGTEASGKAIRGGEGRGAVSTGLGDKGHKMHEKTPEQNLSSRLSLKARKNDLQKNPNSKPPLSLKNPMNEIPGMKVV